MDIEGYYHPNKQKVSALMRPSETLNNALLLATRAQTVSANP